jgi:hypothetical protein
MAVPLICELEELLFGARVVTARTTCPLLGKFAEFFGLSSGLFELRRELSSVRINLAFGNTSFTMKRIRFTSSWSDSPTMRPAWVPIFCASKEKSFARCADRATFGLPVRLSVCPSFPRGAFFFVSIIPCLSSQNVPFQYSSKAGGIVCVL